MNPKMLGYSRAEYEVFTVTEKVYKRVNPKIEVQTRLLRLDELTSQQWRQLKRLQGQYRVLYLKFRYGARDAHILLAFVGGELVHAEWIIPAHKLKARYPFISDNSYSIISCLTAEGFRGLGIYPSQIQKVVESSISAKAFWIWTACTNIASLKGITKAGGIKVGEFRQRKWFWGGISRIRYFSIESNNK